MSQREAALRVAEELVRAAKGRYYKNGWASYIKRDDVEVLLRNHLTVGEMTIYRRMIEEADA